MSGKVDIAKWALSEEKVRQEFEKYFRYIVYLNIKSIELKNTKEQPVTQIVFISDFEGAKLKSFLNPRVISYYTKVLRKYQRFVEKYAHQWIFINVHPTVETFINLIRPYTGQVLNNIEIYGNKKSEWAPKILKYINKDQLPEWYGGTKDFSPLYVIG